MELGQPCVSLASLFYAIPPPHSPTKYFEHFFLIIRAPHSQMFCTTQTHANCPAAHC